MDKHYLMSMMAAAEELARHPEYSGNNAAQDKVCREYGVFLDNMTDDEFKYFSSLVRDFCG